MARLRDRWRAFLIFWLPAMSRPYTARNIVQERGTIAEAVAIIGLPARTVQAMAAIGKIPSAAKLAGSRRWTFDLSALRRWIKHEETKLC